MSSQTNTAVSRPVAPLGQALIGRSAGERVRFRAVGGIMGVDLVDVR